VGPPLDDKGRENEFHLTTERNKCKAGNQNSCSYAENHPVETFTFTATALIGGSAAYEVVVGGGVADDLDILYFDGANWSMFFDASDVGITEGTSLTIQAQASDNAPTFTSTASNISSRTKTTASVPWTPAAWNTVGESGPDQRTPNLAAVIQEVVRRPGWASGNAIAS